MNTKWVIASNNLKKRAEIAAILNDLAIDIVPLEETIFVDVNENGATFAENAAKKARAFAHANQCAALADDSGLCVQALDGAPGVYSARFSGEDATDAENNTKLLQAMHNHENRDAFFTCSMHLEFIGNHPPITADGTVDGQILSPSAIIKNSDAQGFGYDPLFFCPELGQSFAQATPEEKASVSHRGRALRALVSQLQC
ncbi:MAG: RdgB/HAM1 family non-canonical purine NTP pyrophosphatase [Zetaproteobacteria bacterium]|nr:RdgB/HAM1 family non-canonical purine NTP pyrophosphatase [Zetaproteobacteria bacterium]